MTTELPDIIQKNHHQIPPGLALQKVDERIMTLNVGPQHPGSGHMRLIVQIDGDYIVACDPDPGYVHRGEEKMAEYRNYITNIPHLERPVIHDSCNILYPYVLGVEELLGIEVPERAKYVRVIASELKMYLHNVLACNLWNLLRTFYNVHVASR